MEGFTVTDEQIREVIEKTPSSILDHLIGEYIHDQRKEGSQDPLRTLGVKRTPSWGVLFYLPESFPYSSDKMPLRWLAGRHLFLYAFPRKRGISMDSNDFGDLLLMLLDDDLFPVEQEGNNVELLQPEPERIERR